MACRGEFHIMITPYLKNKIIYIIGTLKAETELCEGGETVLCALKLLRGKGKGDG